MGETSMTKGFGKGGSPRQGDVPQRLLLIRLKRLIDDASAKGAGAARDQAKTELREVMNTAHWDTEYIKYNAGVRRCRYLRSVGYPIANRYLFASESDVERITAHNEKER
jgi:hypothetical protein